MEEIREELSALFRKYGLGDICGETEPVSGGLMHKMYKVRTVSKAYAVKCLNPEIMKRPGVLENYAQAEDLERILENRNMMLLQAAQTGLNEARRALPSMRAPDDPDMDPKNIMWNEGKAYVIDLECLGYGNPVESCLNLSLQWAGTVNGRYSAENLEAFFKGYLSVYDNGFRSYEDLYGIAYTWVEWLIYNIRRALGLEGDTEDEIRLGEAEVRNTIERIGYLMEIEEDVRQVLGNLPGECEEK